VGWATPRKKKALATGHPAKPTRFATQLDWQAGILNDTGSKPKGMHWATYQRLKSQHDALVQVSLQDMGRKLGKVAGSVNLFRKTWLWR
jgi:hypothetical protein